MHIRSAALNIFEGQCRLWHLARVGYSPSPNMEARIAVYRYLLCRHSASAVIRHARQIANLLSRIEGDVVDVMLDAWRQ